jgi:glucose-6-phosphate 1-epimerase
VVNS